MDQTSQDGNYNNNQVEDIVLMYKFDKSSELGCKEK